MSTAAVVRTFVRLKWALLRNGLRQTGARAAAFVLSAVVAVLFGLLGMAGMWALNGHEHAAAAAVVLTALVTLGWAFVPLFGAGVDETLDPGRLVLLPLRPRPLLSGQLAASAVGLGPLFTVLLLVGAALATARGAAGTAAAVVAVPLALLVCLALSRALAAANARLLSSRRGRDLAVLSGLVVAFGLQALNLGFSSLADEDGGLGPVETPAAVLRWVPPATAIEGVRAASDGEAVVAVAALAGTALAGVLLLAWWGRTLTRLMTAPDSSTLVAAPESRVARRARASRLPGLFPAGRTGAAAHRVLQYAWRDPKSKMGWVSALGMGLLLPVIWAVQDSGSVYHACWSASMLGLLMFNQFGSDGSGFWLVLQTVGGPADMLAELRGRTLAVAVVGVPFTVLVVVLSAAVLDEWSSLPDALGLALAVLGGLFGIGALTSVHLPYSVPQDNPMRNVAPGQGGLAWSSVLAGGLGAAVLCAPVIALTLWLNGSDSAWSWTVLPVGAAWGALLVWAGLRTAAHRGAARLPEILTAVRAG